MLYTNEVHITFYKEDLERALHEYCTAHNLELIGYDRIEMRIHEGLETIEFSYHKDEGEEE